MTTFTFPRMLGTATSSKSVLETFVYPLPTFFCPTIDIGYREWWLIGRHRINLVFRQTQLISQSTGNQAEAVRSQLFH